MYRRKTPLLQQDIAYLLKIDSGQYSRIEKGSRPPSLDIILIFHLFGSSVHQLFSYNFEAIKETIITQSKKLIEQLKTEQTPKSDNRMLYITNLVNDLIKSKDE